MIAYIKGRLIEKSPDARSGAFEISLKTTKINNPKKNRGK